MSDLSIKVQGIGKQYLRGSAHGAGYRTLREAIRDAVTAPFRTQDKSHQSDKQNARFWALDDVSFDVHKNEIVGLIGRNGAGKSTLLKILSRITEPTRGRAELYGRVASLLEVGTGFHHELTGRENIYLSGAILGLKIHEVRKQFDQIVDFAELGGFIDTPVKRYSSGMYMRLAFAVAAHLQPEILLVDEVLAVGDINFQKKCIGKIEGVARQGRTVLIVSHNLLTIQQLCTRGILLEAGKVIADGNITDTINQYLSSAGNQKGERAWTSEDAPGNDRIKIKAVRIVSEGKSCSQVDIQKDFRIELDYLNLEPNARRNFSIHLHNSQGIFVLSSGNFPSVALKPDPWYSQPYPVGLFRSSCTVPGKLLNDGMHTVSLMVSDTSDIVLSVRDIASFYVYDSGHMRGEYGGEWLGAVRVQLDWNTQPMNEKVLS